LEPNRTDDYSLTPIPLLAYLSILRPKHGLDLATTASGMPMKNKTSAKWKGPGKPRKTPLKEKPVSMSKEEWQDHRITGGSQTTGKYYKRIFDQFNERKQFGDFSSIHMIHNESAMLRQWGSSKRHATNSMATTRRSW
jgi:hypothetical protein